MLGASDIDGCADQMDSLQALETGRSLDVEITVDQYVTFPGSLSNWILAPAVFWMFSGQSYSRRAPICYGQMLKPQSGRFVGVWRGIEAVDVSSWDMINRTPEDVLSMDVDKFRNMA